MIEMRLLEILSAFAEEGTQTAAAEKLHISQPTLSSSMRKLEEEIGAPLFEHTKNRMVLNSYSWMMHLRTRAPAMTASLTLRRLSKTAQQIPISTLRHLRELSLRAYNRL